MYFWCCGGAVVVMLPCCCSAAPLHWMSIESHTDSRMASRRHLLVACLWPGFCFSCWPQKFIILLLLFISCRWSCLFLTLRHATSSGQPTNHIHLISTPCSIARSGCTSLCHSLLDRMDCKLIATRSAATFYITRWRREGKGPSSMSFIGNRVVATRPTTARTRSAKVQRAPLRFTVGHINNYNTHRVKWSSKGGVYEKKETNIKI